MKAIFNVLPVLLLVLILAGADVAHAQLGILPSSPPGLDMLYDFYIKTGGPTHWQQKSGWSMPKDQWENPCGTFSGLTCKDGYAYQLNLVSNGLTGTIPPYFFTNFSSFTVVLLGQNKGLTGPFPFFSANTSLLNFIAPKCSFTGQLPDSIFFPVSMKQLIIDYNAFGGTIPNTIPEGAQLQFLYLGNSVPKISGALPSSICNATSLNTLDLQMSLVTGLPACFGSSTPKVTNLNLFSNVLQGSIPPSWCDMTELQILQVQQNAQLVGELPTCLDRWTKLRTLAVENTGVGGTIPDGLFSLGKTLQSMTLSLSRFHGTLPDKFDVFEKLSTVTLNGSPTPGDPTYTGSLPRSLFALSTITTLSIQHTHINSSIPPMHNMTSLWKIALANNPKLRATFPTELLTELWATPSSTPARELHFEQANFGGTLPFVDNRVYNLQQRQGGITMWSNSFVGYIPNSTLDWVPPASQPGLLRNCPQLLAPVEKWMYAVTGNFIGRQFTSSMALPTKFNMDGGEQLTIVGATAFYDLAGDIKCGFCLSGLLGCSNPPNSIDGSFNNTGKDLVLTDAVYEPNANIQGANAHVFKCKTPPVSINSTIGVGIFFQGHAYSDTVVDIYEISSERQPIWFYNPRPIATSVEPAHGRLEGCVSLTVRGSGFLNAPLPTVFIGTNPTNFDDADVHIACPDARVVTDSELVVLLPLADAKNYSIRYSQKFALNESLSVFVYPDNYTSTTAPNIAPLDKNTAAFEFISTCDTPLTPCQYGFRDPYHCPLFGGLCLCNSVGICISPNKPNNSDYTNLIMPSFPTAAAAGHSFGSSSESYQCKCATGYSGPGCGQCDDNRYGPRCMPCECVAGHGTCNDGMDNSGTCNCHSTWLGSTCAVSKVALGVCIPLGAFILAVGGLWLRRMRSVKHKVEQDTLLNAQPF